MHMQGFSLYRNPLYQNAGKLVSLSEFLVLAQKATSLSGMLVSIENALNVFKDIKSSADSIIPQSDKFTTGVTNNFVRVLQSFGRKVYVQLFQNEFVSQDWDFYSDPTVEITEFVFGAGAGVDGVVADFPRTTALYNGST